jgi:Zn-dependent M28 family amino/carboxypeptidase
VSVDAARLEAHVRMLSETCAPRDEAHVENLDRAAHYIAAEFAAAGGAVREQPYTAGGRAYKNVIATFGPTTGARVVVGAHYDAAGPFPGADDNASGVAGLIELARLIGRAPPPAPVELVAFTLEEPPWFRTGLMGSQVHARALRESGAEVRAMIAVEMIGCFTDAPGSQHFPTSLLRPFYPSAGNFIAVIGRLGGGGLVRRVKRAMRGAAPLPVHALVGPRFIPGVDFSDHASYWDEGFPAAMVTDTAFYRNPRYHTADDRADTLDYHRMAQVVSGLHAAVQALAR